MTNIRPEHSSRLSVDPAVAYRAARDSVALCDLRDHAMVELRGKDRLSFLHNFCTNDIKRLGPGEGCEAFITNIKGRILNHVRVFATVESVWLDCDATTIDSLVAHLDQYLISEDVQIRSSADEVGVLYLCGPLAESWLRAHASGLLAGHADWPRFAEIDGEIDGHPVMMIRCDLTQSAGFLLLLKDRNEIDPVWRTITARGVTAVGAEVFEALRIEAGVPRIGIDIGEANIAQEAGRTAHAISFNKGCYLGQEPIARLDALGHVNQELRSIAFEPGPTPAKGAEILAPSGTIVGTITSAALSYDGEPHPVALAVLKTSVTAPGSGVSVATPAGPSLSGRVFWHPLASAT